MSLRMSDVSEVVYGGVVTLGTWWDEKRITAGTLTDKEVLKKASFWTYLGIGIPATLMTAMNWWDAKAGKVTERLAHGFLFGFPAFLYTTVKSMKETTSTRGDAVAQAQEILRQRSQKRANAEHAGAKTGYEVISPYEILT